MQQVNAGTTAYLTIAPVDQNGNPAAPTSGTFRVDDAATGTSLIPATAITPGTSIPITLTSVATAAVGISLAPQTRIVTINLVYGTNDNLNIVYTFQVIPLQF